MNLPTKADSPAAYSNLERDDALTCLALGSGNPARVNELLSDKGITIPLSTIKSWAYGSEKENYQRIRAEVEHFRSTRIADQIKANALLAGEVVDESLTQLQGKLKGTKDQPPEELDAKDLASIGKNSAVVMGIHVQRGEELESKPTVNVNIDFQGLLQEFKDLGGDPEAITAEVVEEQDLLTTGES